MEVLIFDVWGDVGFFKKHFSTSSPLTFPFPPKTTIGGMLASILGKDKDTYYDLFSEESLNVALRILSPVKKMKFNTNLLDTKGRPNNYYTQVGFEILKKPAFRIFIYHNDKDTFERIQNLLKNHKTQYTLTLGLGNCLCNFKYIGTSELKEANLEKVDTVVPINSIEQILTYGQYFKVKMPTDFNKNRIVKNYREYMFERNGNSIGVKTKGHIVEITSENITFM